MEYLDIYDSEGKLTGIKKTKKEAHSEGLWHKAVHVWVVNSKKELLIQKRSPIVDSYPNKLDISAAGHVSAGEDDVTSALREAEEEIGLKLTKKDLVKIGVIKQIHTPRADYINNEINPIFIVKMDLNLNKIKKQVEEVSEVKYIPYKELKNLVENKGELFVPHPEEYKLLFDYLENKWN